MPDCTLSFIRQQSLTSIGFLVRPLRGRMERGNQGTPLKPRQGPCPWTPLLKNLYLKDPRAPGRGLRPSALPLYEWISEKFT